MSIGTSSPSFLQARPNFYHIFHFYHTTGEWTEILNLGKSLLLQLRKFFEIIYGDKYVENKEDEDVSQMDISQYT